ncbi:MAG: sulfite exporter TauE/SafE family protein [Candidatus Omnitrophota bacterium]|nr:MAG: sulfite exporter TauE/SafE family protein [Candidatus Omnitrophota bacterium]
MNNELTALYITAASLGFIHTIFGPDHYLPFIMMARARKWSMAKTALITLLCGLGHIMSSVVLGIVGIVMGIGVMKLEAFEAFRGNLAGWALITFGFVYFVWGLHRILRNKPHTHLHVEDKEGKKNITPWVLFTIFVLGPCEPLIPILMYPAAKNSIMGLVWVTAIFGSVTIMTMFTIVMISALGVNLIPLRRLERYTHALAGGTICLCGVAIQFLGL